MASPARFELTAPGLGILCSILLSYGDNQNVGPDNRSGRPFHTKSSRLCPSAFRGR